MNYQFSGFIILMTLIQNVFADAMIPERRSDQYLTQAGYFAVPLPYSVPGIGSGIVFLGNMTNVNNSTADINVLSITGDAGGWFLFAKEIPLYERWLSMETLYQNINRANVNVYQKRGMEGSNKDDFNIVEVGLFKKIHNALVFNLYEKRLNFQVNYDKTEFRQDTLKDHDGNVLKELDLKSKNNQTTLSLDLDLTDDHFDPRKGMRIDLSYQNHKSKESKSADLFVLDYGLSGYVPMGKFSTLALNYFQSDAHVTREGETDIDVIRTELGDCDPGASDYADCISAREELALNTYYERKYGTASDIGGDQRLRAYPGGRFKGAHAAYFGAEFRWNFVQEATPFNYWIWRDVRSGYQMAIFIESASVSELASDLWKERRYSAGVGFRLITASGGIYRADFAKGNEDTEVSIIFDYPW